MAEVTLEGYEELLKQFDELADMPDNKRMEKRLLRRARKLRNEIRKRAPRTKPGSGSINVRTGSFLRITGNLKRAVYASKFRNKYKGSPAVYVRINRRIAPHAHLVEYGTDQSKVREPSETKTWKRGARKGTVRHARKALHFRINGEEVFAKWVAPMPPNPFFRSTVDKEYHMILSGIEKDVILLIREIEDK